MGDWFGVGFFLLLIIGVFVGLKVISKPRVSTSAEFERNAAEGKTMLGASMNALQQSWIRLMHERMKLSRK